MQDIVSFLNSNLLIALVTLFVGSFAILLYWKQRRDHKRDAAKIIFQEVQSGERALKQIKESLLRDPAQLPADIFAMPSESWSKYKYMFINDLDRDEWDNLNNFYNKCQLIDESIQYNNSFFHMNVEQIAVNKQRVLADYSREHANAQDNYTEYEDIVKKFDDLYSGRGQTKAFYSPQKPINDAKLYMGSLSLEISQTSIGTKLKKVANRRI